MTRNAWLLACFALLAAACTPSPSPEGGGQTGDPGVTDFISLDPDANGKPGTSGSEICPAAVQVHGEPAPDSVQVQKLGEAHMAVFDPQRGLSVVQIDTPSPRIVGQLPLSRRAGRFHVSGTLGFLSSQNFGNTDFYLGADTYYRFPRIGSDAQLTVLDLSNPGAPRVLHTRQLQVRPRTSTLVVSAGRIRWYVIQEDSSWRGGCALESFLVSYEWTDGELVEGAKLRLVKADVEVVAERLVMRRGPDVSFLSLASADGWMIESQPLPGAPGGQLFKIHVEDENTWRLAGTRALDDPAVVISSYDIRDPQAIVQRSACTVGALRTDHLSFTPRHTFLVAPFSEGRTVTSVAHQGDGTCEVRKTEGGYQRFVISAGTLPARVIDIDQDERGMVLRLLDDADLKPVSETVVPGAYREISAESVTRAHSDGSQALLGLSVREAFDSAPALHLFEVAPGAIRALGALPPALRLDGLETSDPLAWTGPVENGVGLARVQLGTTNAPQLSEAVDISPRFSQLLSLGTHWVRLRLPAGAVDGDVSVAGTLHPRVQGSLELVPIDEDPDRGRAVASIAAHPQGRLYRAGSKLVSVINGSGIHGKHMLLEVFDANDPARLVRSAEFEEHPPFEELSQVEEPPNCLTCDDFLRPHSLLGLPDALVRVEGANQLPQIRVLDLSNASAPVLSEPITPSARARGVSAFVAGTSVYYAYREPTDNGARFYFRRVDLSRPSAPQLGPAVNVPGELVAIDGTRLYTREVARSENGGYETRIHRLELLANGAKLVASHTLGNRASFAVALDDAGHLLVETRESLDQFLEISGYLVPPVTLKLLDATTLAQVGETEVGRDAALLAVRGKQVLYAVARGFGLVNLDRPEMPFLQAYAPRVYALPLVPAAHGTAVLEQERAAFVDGDAIHQLERTTANILR
jgi:hypothetical protein